MIRLLQRLFLNVFKRVEAGFSVCFGDHWNPWYQLGALSFHFFWILVITGLYLFIFFDTSITEAYLSVEYMTREQWYLGGVMRSLHRYSSDGMAITVTLHLLREFSLGRFRGVRRFSWVAGVPLLWLLFASAIGGYWLVWDQLAQYIAVVTTEWFAWLPMISDALPRNFLSEFALSDRLITLLVFMHIAIPLFLLLGMFIHIKRIKLPHSNPPRGLAIGTIVALIVLAAAKPAVSMGPANMSQTVAIVDLDWFFLNVYPLLDYWGPGAVWGLLAGISILLVLLPWLSPEHRNRTRVAKVDPNNCMGCGWCSHDCPHEAITMVNHDFKKGHRQAQVNPDLCTACGICTGACPTATPFRHIDELISGIELPDFSIDHLRTELDQKIAVLKGESHLVVFGCDHALDIERVAGDGVMVMSLPCIGLLPPSFADYVARKEMVDGVLISGCCSEDCFFRKGSEWTDQRFHKRRNPHLRTRAGRHKVKICWAGARETTKLLSALDEFRIELARHEESELEKSERAPSA